MDAQSEAKLNEVDPTLADIIRQLADVVSSQYGGSITVVSGYRSYEKQAALYANRASNRNPVAKPGTSKHEQGLAVDLRMNGIAADTVGVLGESLGLRWGGRFSKRDPGHFELSASGVQDTGSDTAGGSYSLPIDTSSTSAGSADDYGLSAGYTQDAGSSAWDDGYYSSFDSTDSMYDVSADDPEASSIFPYLLLGLAALIVIEIVW
jgi:hypothetical protein